MSQDPFEFNRFLRKLLRKPPEVRAAWEKAMRENNPEGYKEVVKFFKSNPAAFDEAEGYEHWLKKLGPLTFTRPFSPIQHRFWAWNWNILQKLIDNIPLEPREFVGFLPHSRETGKSSNVEWACIAEGALLRTGYIIYLSAKQLQAEEHVVAIRNRIESEHVDKVYPWLSKPKMGQHGNKFGWSKDFLMTSGGWAIRPVGADQAIRGGKTLNLRPTLIVCHEKGTRICDDGKWVNVENHPTAVRRFSNGYRISLWGLPISETVTPEHRYWVREYVRRAKGEDNYVEGMTGWMQAGDLHDHCWIGTPVSTSLGNPESLSIFHYATKERNAKGQLIGAAKNLVFRDVVPPEFNDPDWWWFFGLWWGDGHTTKYQVGVTINDRDTHIFERLRALLGRYGKPYSTVPKAGCTQIVFCAAHLSHWLKTWRVGNSRKQPPQWVESLPLEMQRQLLRGYVDADGWVNEKNQEVRITSIYLDGLLSARRVLARLGVAASIRRGAGPRLEKFASGYSWSQQKYDLRFKDNAAQFGFNIRNQSRYALSRLFIADGFLWSKVRSIDPVAHAEFVPIQTNSGTYLTHFGLSHNCDDLDELGDSPYIVEHKENLLTRSVLPMGNEKTRVLVPQNPIHANSVVNRMLTGVSLALAIRTVFGEIDDNGNMTSTPIAAVKDFDYEVRQSDDGPYSVITRGKSLWPGIDLAGWERTLNRVGPAAFKAEYQHDMSIAQEERVLPEYDDRVLRLHVVTWSQFLAKYGHSRIPSDWPCSVGLDLGYSSSHRSAWSFLAKVPEGQPLSGSVFLYRARTFIGISIDEQAVTIRSQLWPDELIERQMMSHEKLGERILLSTKHNWFFQPCESAKTAGIPQWRHFLQTDRSQPHPFHRDERDPNGQWKLGRPAFFNIVADDQFFAPRDDLGQKNHRDSAYNWRMRPIKLNESGLTVEQPMKADDDETDSVRMCFSGTASFAEKQMTQAQRTAALIPSGYSRQELMKRPDIDPTVATMTANTAEWFARRTMAEKRPKPRDPWGQSITSR